MSKKKTQSTKPKQIKLTPEEIADHLKMEGNELSQKGESHYYQIRKRFNQDKNAKDFVF